MEMTREGDHTGRSLDGAVYRTVAPKPSIGGGVPGSGGQVRLDGRHDGRVVGCDERSEPGDDLTIG